VHASGMSDGQSERVLLRVVMLRRTTCALAQRRTRGRCWEVLDERDRVYAHIRISWDDTSALEGVGGLTGHLRVRVNENRTLEGATEHVL
jgi:hypothetical protein